MYLNTWAQQKHYKQSPMTSQSTGESTDDTQIEDKDLVFWISKQLLQITKGETNNKMISKDYSQVNKKSENTNDSEKFEKLLKLASNQRKSRQNNRLQTGQRVIPAALAETGGQWKCPQCRWKAQRYNTGGQLASQYPLSLERANLYDLKTSKNLS